MTKLSPAKTLSICFIIDNDYIKTPLMVNTVHFVIVHVLPDFRIFGTSTDGSVFIHVYPTLAFKCNPHHAQGQNRLQFKNDFKTIPMLSSLKTGDYHVDIFLFW